MPEGKHLHVAFLRAINVAGRAIVKMDDLRRAFEDAGCANVKTFLQSGNVTFKGGGAALLARIGANVTKLAGEKATVIYRTAGEIAALRALDPFEATAREDVKCYVAFLLSKPGAAPALPLVAKKDGLELIQLNGLDALVVSRPIGGGRYGFPNNFIEKALGVPATSRNWNTIVKIADAL